MESRWIKAQAICSSTSPFASQSWASSPPQADHGGRLEATGPMKSAKYKSLGLKITGELSQTKSYWCPESFLVLNIFQAPTFPNLFPHPNTFPHPPRVSGTHRPPEHSPPSRRHSPPARWQPWSPRPRTWVRPPWSACSASSCSSTSPAKHLGKENNLGKCLGAECWWFCFRKLMGSWSLGVLAVRGGGILKQTTVNRY
jgi:hypothetical protein